MLAREAYDSVCAKVAQMYEADGWKYAKSSHWMTKKTKDFTYKVRFYSSIIALSMFWMRRIRIGRRKHV